MKTLLALFLSSVAAFAQLTSFRSFNTNQFNYTTNNYILSVKDGAVVTNVNNITTLFINGTNIFNLFAPAGSSGGGDSLWTNIDNTLQPLSGVAVLVTNLTSSEALTASGAFLMSASDLVPLDLGTNCVNPNNLGTIRLLGSTSDPADTSFTLVSGNGQGQIIILLNSTTNSAFTMFNGAEMCDASGGFIRLNGDWVSDTKGDALILFNTGFIWTEVGRAGGSTNVIADGVWENALGIVRPVPANLNTELRFTSDSADALTNRVLRLDTATFWTGEDDPYLEFGNGGTNFMFVPQWGGWTIGRDAANQWGGQPGVVAFFNTALGEPYTSELTVGVTDDGSIYNYGTLFISTNSAASTLEMGLSGSVPLKFLPGVASSGTAVAYKFDTANALTTDGDILQSWGMTGTNVAYMNPHGGIYVGRSIPLIFPSSDDVFQGWHDSRTGESSTTYFNVGAGQSDDAGELSGAMSFEGNDDGSFNFTLGANNTPNTQYFDLIVAANRATDYFQLRMIKDSFDLMSFSPTITSGIAYNFDTSNQLTNGDSIFVVKNLGVAKASIVHDGGIAIGTVTPTAYGPIGNGETLVSYRDTASGGFNDLITGVWDDATHFSMTELNQGSVTNSYSSVQTKIAGVTRSIFAETGLNTLHLRMETEGGNIARLDPNVASTGSAKAYILGTINVLTNGDTFVSIQNQGTELLGIAPNAFGSSLISFGPGATNKIERSSAQKLRYISGGAAPVFEVNDGSNAAQLGVASTTSYVSGNVALQMSGSTGNMTLNATELIFSPNNTISIGNGSFDPKDITMAGSVKTGNPNGGTAARWKLGTLVTAAVTPDATRYIELDVAGTLYKVIIAQ